MRVNPDLAAKVQAAASGLDHGGRELLAMDLARVASGEEVELLRCHRGTMRLWMDQPRDGVALKDETALLRMSEEDAASIRSLGLDPARVAQHMPPPKVKRTGPPTLSPEEREQIKRLGLDPERVLTAMKATDASDYQVRLKAAGRG